MNDKIQQKGRRYRVALWRWVRRSFDDNAKRRDVYARLIREARQDRDNSVDLHDRGYHKTHIKVLKMCAVMDVRPNNRNLTADEPSK